MDAIIMISGIASQALVRPYGTGHASTATSGSDVSIGSRQVKALIPTELTPLGSGSEKQEVSSQAQEQQKAAEEIRQSAEKANAYLKYADTHLEFIVSEQTGRVVVHVVDTETKEVVRAIPPETLERFATQTSQLQGLLIQATG